MTFLSCGLTRENRARTKQNRIGARGRIRICSRLGLMGRRVRLAQVTMRTSCPAARPTPGCSALLTSDEFCHVAALCEQNLSLPTANFSLLLMSGGPARLG